MLENRLSVEQLSTILLILPFLAAVVCYLIRINGIRKIVVLITGGVLITAALLLIPLSPFSLSPKRFLGVNIHVIVQALDFLLLLIILYFGFKYRHIVVIALALLQIIFLAYLEFFLIHEKQDTSTLYCDHLALVMVLIVSIVGSLICFQAIPCMKNHEEHLRLKRSRQHQFFFVMIMFLGAIEQRVASRDIEDMRGLYADMPLTALMTVMGVIMMIMPPFGILLGKWMAMESAANNLYVIMMIALGSALMVMYWARWAGKLMSDPFAGGFKPERQPFLTWLTLSVLCAGAGLLSMAAPWLYGQMIVPALNCAYLPPYTAQNGILQNPYGVFAVFPLSLVAALGFVVAVLAVKRAAKARVVKPYLRGVRRDLNSEQIGQILSDLSWIEDEIGRLETILLSDYTVKKTNRWQRGFTNGKGL